MYFRRLWQHVTESLRQKDIDKATEHKRILEERQRSEERHRAETETEWRTRYFDREVRNWTTLCSDVVLLSWRFSVAAERIRSGYIGGRKY